MPYPYEFTKREVQGPACDYANLCSYNSAYTQGVLPPVPSSALSPMQYLIPSYGASGYQTLTHNSVGPTCNGYFNMNSAYGNTNNCGCYTTALCSGNCGNPMQPRSSLWY